MIPMPNPTVLRAVAWVDGEPDWDQLSREVAKAEKKLGPVKEKERFTFDDLTDDGLVRLIRNYRRNVEDGCRNPTQVKEWIARCREIQLARFALRMRYGAIDNHKGTKVYDRWYRFNDPPTYSLAASMDRCRAERGLSHVLDWPVAA